MCTRLFLRASGLSPDQPYSKDLPPQDKGKLGVVGIFSSVREILQAFNNHHEVRKGETNALWKTSAAYTDMYCMTILKPCDPIDPKFKVAFAHPEQQYMSSLSEGAQPHLQLYARQYGNYGGSMGRKTCRAWSGSRSFGKFYSYYLCNTTFYSKVIFLVLWYYWLVTVEKRSFEGRYAW